MANIIQNGDFERSLNQWEILTDIFIPYIRTQESPVAPRGRSFYIEIGRDIGIEQSFPWVVFARETHLHFSFRGNAADFFINIYYEDGTMNSTHFYGHWPLGWENNQVPVSIEKGIIRLEIKFEYALDFYLDDITLDGSSIHPFLRYKPGMRKIPEEIYDYDLRFPHPPIKENLEGIERELKQISALLSKQLYPNMDKKIEEVLAKYTNKKNPIKKDKR